ncbi:MAG: hypothetical protein HY327_00900 [Chloroflexi bacterium]|nr:hypothetical protein [Chloroflexota bacterium]
MDNTKISAFVGHSFADADREVVRKFTDFLNHVRDLGIGFIWDHAEDAEAKDLSQKVVEKMDGKNLFIGICTRRERAVSPENLRPLPLIEQWLIGNENELTWKTSDWIIQEIGYAFGKGNRSGHIQVVNRQHWR